MKRVALRALGTLRWRWPALVLLAGMLLAGCADLDTQQRKWIFNTERAAARAAVSLGQIEGMDELWIEHRSAATGAEVKLHALWQAHDDPHGPVLLYLHGAGRSVHASRTRIKRMRDLGFSVLAIDYRGFGRSTAELPSEASVYEDARAAWDWLAKTHAGRPRYIYGHSLGGAIAIQLASEGVDARGLMVEGTFTSIADVFETLRWGWLPVKPFITQRFDSLDKIERVKVPVLVVHGSRDGIIRPDLGRALYERAKAPKRFVLIEGGTHYSTHGLGLDQYRGAMRELFGLL